MRCHTPLLTLALAAATAAPLAAQGAMRALPSGRATTAVTLVSTDGAAPAAARPIRIVVDHGQPHLRGRTLHTDSLVPYDTPWRTGANDPTTLTTDVDLVLGGTRLPRGRYVLQTVPGRTAWTLLVQRDTASAPASPEAPAPPTVEVARVPLRVTTLPAPIESLTFWLIPSTQPGAPRGELRFAWGRTSLATDWSVP